MIPDTEPLRNIPRIDFHSPVHHDPALVAAEFTLHTEATGETVAGCIYADGSCSCSDFKAHGHCFHAAAWLVECWSAVYAMADADEERKEQMIEIFAEVA